MKTLLMIFSLALPLVAGAQEVWRCGPQGRVFSNVPCAEGQRLDVAQLARPAADLHAANEQATRDQRLADTLRRERLARETAQRGNGLAGFNPAVAVKPDSKAPMKHRSKRHQAHPEDAGTWRAVAPATPRTKG
jgi:hypothetical protein